MTSPILSESVRKFLDANFPGSSLDDGYYFVSIGACPNWRVHDWAVQQVSDRLAGEGTWLVTVGVDPRPYTNARYVEQRTVVYTPDWNVEKKLIQWLAELAEPGIRIRPLLDAETVPGAAAIVNPQQGIVFNANARRLYARDHATLERLLDGMEDAVAERIP